MEIYYPCTWLSFVNQKNEKIRNWNLLMKIISAVPKQFYFKTTDVYTVYADNWICKQLKHHQLRIRSEIFLSIKIILNVFNVWQYHLRRLFQLASSGNLICCQMILLSSQSEEVHFSSWENRNTNVHTFIKRIKPFFCHCISMPW